MRLPAVLRALEAPRYRRYFIGQALSILGTWIQTVAMSWLVYRLTGSATLLGLTAFLAQVPQLVVSPLAGAFIDRLDRRRMFLVVQGLMITQAMVLAALTATGVIETWHLIVLAGSFGLINAVDVPLRQSMLSGLVDDKTLLRNAVALNASLFNGARFVGPPLAGVILALTSEAVCFAINGLSFLGVAIAVALLPAPPRRESTGNIAQALAEGMRFALSSLPIRTLLMGIAGLNATGSAFMVLMPVLAKDTFGGNEQTLGWLLGASGGGALIGTLLVASRQNTCQLVRLVATGWLLAAVGLAFLGGTGELAVAMLASTGIGMGITSVNVSTNAVLQSLTPDAIRGRVISFFTAFRFGMDALGGLLAGLLTHRYGVQPVLCGEAVMVVLGTLWMASQIRRVSRAAAGAGV
jgi:MFS family permease